MSQLRNLIVAVVSATALIEASAAPFTWNGANSSGGFTDGDNWIGNVAPPSGSDLLFGADSGIGLAGLDAGITFNAPTVTFLAGASAGFFLTAASASDILNITGSGTSVTNASGFQMSTSTLTVSIGTSQTWDGGASGLNISNIDLGNNRLLTLTGTGTTPTTRNEIGVNIDGTGTSGILKEGSGLLLFAGVNSYTGSTTISQGVLQLGGNERILNTSNLIMNGGIFDLNGFSETMGSLDLNGNAIIDFGSGIGQTFTLAASNAQVWDNFTLTILNGTGNTLKIGNDATGLDSGKLANNIRFEGTTPGQISSGGVVTPVPEPASTLLVGLGLASLLVRRRPQKS